VPRGARLGDGLLITSQEGALPDTAEMG
jgi:hypothetical protein